jgi:hypothetical protein
MKTASTSKSWIKLGEAPPRNSKILDRRVSDISTLELDLETSNLDLKSSGLGFSKGIWKLSAGLHTVSTKKQLTSN